MSSDGRALPSALDMERLVLGSMIMSTVAISKASDILDDGRAFYHSRHRIIYRAIITCYLEGTDVDLPTLVQELDSKGKLEECGGIVYISDLAASGGTSVNVEQYAHVVLEMWTRRKIIADSQEMISAAYDKALDLNENVARFVSKCDAAMYHSDAHEKYQLVWDIVDKMASNEKTKFTARLLPTHFPNVKESSELDEALNGGLMTKRMSLLFALPSVGKTSLVARMAHCMSTFGTKVGYFNLEDGSEAIAGVVAAQEERLHSAWYYSDRPGVMLDPEDKERLRGTADYYRPQPFRVESLAQPTVDELMMSMRAMKRIHGLDIAIIDSLSLMKYNTMHEVNQLAGIMATLAGFALREDIHVMLLHHARDRIATRDFYDLPTIEDISLSPQAARRYCYYIFTLHCPCTTAGRPKIITPEWRDRAEFGILKQKDAENTRWISYKYDRVHRLHSNWPKGRQQFRNYDTQHIAVDDEDTAY